MNSLRKLRIYIKTRDFLFSLVNKDFLVFLFFLALSGVFWLLMALNETYEREISVNLRLVNIPKNVIVTNDINDTIKLTVRDKGYTIGAYIYGGKIPQVKVTFSSYIKDTGYGAILQADIQKMIYPHLYGSTKIVQIKPDKVEYYYNFGLNKQVPVRMLGKVTLGQSYYLARTVFSPQKITVYAAKNVLDSIRFVYTEPINIMNISDTAVYKVKLRKIRGAKCIPDVVSITLYPDILTEESMEVPIVALNMPADKVLRTFPARVKVKFIIGASLFRSIKQEQFRAVVDYNELINDNSNKCTVSLRALPAGVTNAYIENNQVDYLIENR